MTSPMEVARGAYVCIRAPASGKLGEIVVLQPGSVVSKGLRLSAVVPPGGLQVTADFPPAVAVRDRGRAGDLRPLRAGRGGHDRARGHRRKGHRERPPAASEPRPLHTRAARPAGRDAGGLGLAGRPPDHRFPEGVDAQAHAGVHGGDGPPRTPARVDPTSPSERWTAANSRCASANASTESSSDISSCCWSLSAKGCWITP